MKKEVIIIVFIIILIVSLNYITQKYTKNTVYMLAQKLEEIKKTCLEEKNEEINKMENEIQEVWKKRKYWLLYYIEHDELEKVETKINLIKGNTEAEEYSETISDIEDVKFILRHIQEKYECISQNIF